MFEDHQILLFVAGALPELRSGFLLLALLLAMRFGRVLPILAGMIGGAVVLSVFYVFAEIPDEPIAQPAAWPWWSWASGVAVLTTALWVTRSGKWIGANEPPRGLTLFLVSFILYVLVHGALFPLVPLTIMYAPLLDSDPTLLIAGVLFGRPACVLLAAFLGRSLGRRFRSRRTGYLIAVGIALLGAVMLADGFMDARITAYFARTIG